LARTNSELVKQLGVANELTYQAAKIEKELRAEIGALNMENAELEAHIDDLQKQLSLSANGKDESPHQKTA